MINYQNKEIILATQHKKEDAIRPIFEKILNCKIIVPAHYNTNQFGTFSGEIERKGSAKETCIEKARQAALKFGINFAIASEGSFGPHPKIPFVAAGIELLILIDLKNDLIISEQMISTETNYSHLDLHKGESYQDYLAKVSFPSHGIIIRALDTQRIIAKGVQAMDALERNIAMAFKESESIRLETDMRAMMNPTRMKVITQLATKLADRLISYCPACKIPGFPVLSTDGNLPCNNCKLPTSFYQRIIESCIKCDYKIFKPRADGLLEADCTYCDYCNP